MDAPFGINFLKKAELYSLICRLDQQEKDTRDPSNALWPIEKQILKWTYTHHKHLGSPITVDHLTSDEKWSKLNEMGFLNSEGELKKKFEYLGVGPLDKPLENLVERGFARYFSEQMHSHSAIVISKEGLLVGEVLSEIDEKGLLIKLNYLIYSKIMGHLGAVILIAVSLLGLIKLFGLDNIFSSLFK